MINKHIIIFYVNVYEKLFELKTSCRLFATTYYMAVSCLIYMLLVKTDLQYRLYYIGNIHVKGLSL